MSDSMSKTRCILYTTCITFITCVIITIVWSPLKTGKQCINITNTNRARYFVIQCVAFFIRSVIPEKLSCTGATRHGSYYS